MTRTERFDERLTPSFSDDVTASGKNGEHPASDLDWDLLAHSRGLQVEGEDQAGNSLVIGLGLGVVDLPLKTIVSPWNQGYSRNWEGAYRMPLIVPKGL